MTLKELQLKIAERLNADEALLRGGCRAFAEDTHDVVQEVATHLREAGHPPGRPLFVVTHAKSYASRSPQSGITA